MATHGHGPGMKTITIYLGDRDRKIVQQAAQAGGRSLSNWFRRFVPPIAEQQLGEALPPNNEKSTTAVEDTYTTNIEHEAKASYLLPLRGQRHRNYNEE